MTAYCRKCRKSKDETHFSVVMSAPNQHARARAVGLAASCMECRGKSDAVRVILVKKETSIYQKKYRADNKSKTKVVQARYYQANKVRLNEKKRQRRLAGLTNY